MHLLRHLQDVYEAAVRVFDATADNQLIALGLEPREYRGRFRRCLLLASAIHDIGKANDHFQGMLLGTRSVPQQPQGIRHEWVSVLILTQLKGWLLPVVEGCATDFSIAEWAVAGHHPAYNHESPPRASPLGAGATIRLHTAHEDFKAILGWVQETFALPGDPPVLGDSVRSLIGAHNAFSEVATWSKRAQRLWDETLRHSADCRLVAAVKTSMVAADVAGSALPRQIPQETERWANISRAFSRIPTASDLDFLATHGLEGYEPRAFQTAVAAHPDQVVYVKAGCGTGKTVAAYLRAAKQYGGRRLYFCYPTTGTATEGFRDYLYPDLPEPGESENTEDVAARRRIAAIEADLFHSRSDIDFEIILGTGSDSTTQEEDLAARADALEAWSTPVVACTVDTVLGLVQTNKRGVFAWPALAQSAFVFDEIHAYDDRLFGALLRFLRDLPGLPALLMTASLPAPREQALREVLRSHRGIDLSPITGPRELEELPRYHKAVTTGGPLPLVVDELRAGGKVLWVCNTVRRVMAAAVRAEAAGLTPLIYHSRFKYVDRVQRHKSVIDTFTARQTGGALAVTSQVCEVSLDLTGCTLLVTEQAPVPALIQRLGRLNRHAKHGDSTRPFVVVTLSPQNHWPYSQPDLDAAARWLSTLPERDISQRHLADAWEQTSQQPPDVMSSAWLDGGPVTTVSELRDASPGITVIMRDDVARATRRNFGKFTLPMPPPPKHLDWRSWPKSWGIPVAPADSLVYDAQRGAEWRK
jgi:CRISPR-associated endonuclease/helicase Cas3